MANVTGRLAKGNKFHCRGCGTEDESLRATPYSRDCSTCKRTFHDEANKRWHEKNKETNNAKAKARYAANAEQICEQTRDACREYSRKRRAENPELMNARMTAWREANRDRDRANVRRYAAAHPEVYRAKAKSRRAMKMGVERTLTSAEWEGILIVFGYACAYCLRSDVQMTQDHMTPIRKKGNHSVDNVVPACGSCNSKKGPGGILSMVNQITRFDARGGDGCRSSRSTSP